MQRLIIHLKKVDKVSVLVKNPKTKQMQNKTKIYNTLSFMVSNEKEILHHLSMNSENIKSHRISACK